MVSPLSSRGRPPAALAPSPGVGPPSTGRDSACGCAVAVHGLHSRKAAGIAVIEGLLRPRQTLSPAVDRQLRGYVVARAIDGRHVEGPDLTRLRNATATVEQVRALLLSGRGNVKDDIARFGHESSRRVEAGRLVKNMLVEHGLPRVVAYAAGGILAQAGNCAEFAALTIMLHVPLLKEASSGTDKGEFICLVKSQWIDHDWAELRDGRGPDYHMVLDPWLRGPAVFSADSQWAGDAGDFTLSLEHGHASGLKDRAEMETALTGNSPSLLARFDQGLREVGPTMRYAPHTVFPSMAVVGRGFERRVQLKLQAPVDVAKARVPPEVRALNPNLRRTQRALLNEVLAVGVARQMDVGAGIRSATQEVPGLLDAARRLRNKGA